MTCLGRSASGGGDGRETVDAVRKPPRDALPHHGGVKERQRAVEENAMGDATARLGLLDLVFKPQAPAGQLHLRSKERVGLNGHECEGQRSRAWRLALAL